MKQHFLYLICILVFSCNSSDAEIKLLFSKVMEVHDGVMPKTDKIHTLKKELSATLSPKNDSTAILNAMKDLDDADEAMMVWMSEFNPNYTSMSINEQKEYLNMEHEKINKVKLLMLESIDKGSQLLDKSNKTNEK
jgi:hypothetical protein